MNPVVVRFLDGAIRLFIAALTFGIVNKVRAVSPNHQ